MYNVCDRIILVINYYINLMERKKDKKVFKFKILFFRKIYFVEFDDFDFFFFIDFSIDWEVRIE